MADNTEIAVAIARFEERMDARDKREERMAADIASIRQHMEANYVNIREFKPVQRIGYLIASGFILAIVGAIASLVIKR